MASEKWFYRSYSALVTVTRTELYQWVVKFEIGPAWLQTVFCHLKYKAIL
jgi:hypothetical protein